MRRAHVLGEQHAALRRSSADCTKYATVVSYLVSTTDATDPTTLKVTQGGKVLPAKRLSAGHYAVDANPTAGDAVISQ